MDIEKRMDLRHVLIMPAKRGMSGRERRHKLQQLHSSGADKVRMEGHIPGRPQEDVRQPRRDSEDLSDRTRKSDPGCNAADPRIRRGRDQRNRKRD